MMFYGGSLKHREPPKQPKPFAEEVQEAVKVANDYIKDRENAKNAVIAQPPEIDFDERKMVENPNPEGMPSKGTVATLGGTTTAGGETTPGTRGEEVEKSEEKNKVRTVPHRVEMEDTWKRLALKYHTTMNVIKKWNNIKHRSLNPLLGRVIEIPVGVTFVQEAAAPTNPKVLLQMLIKEFSRMAPGCEYKRCEYYLRSNDMDLKKAVDQWREDDEWEQGQTALGKGPVAEKLREDEAKRKAKSTGQNKKKRGKKQSQTKAQTRGGPGNQERFLCAPFDASNPPPAQKGVELGAIKTVAVSTYYV